MIRAVGRWKLRFLTPQAVETRAMTSTSTWRTSDSNPERYIRHSDHLVLLDLAELAGTSKADSKRTLKTVTAITDDRRHWNVAPVFRSRVLVAESDSSAVHSQVTQLPSKR